jgi:hypothetical protein
MTARFLVTWDYLCPFARNAHEHIVTALKAGADWDVGFRFFSLSQSHVPEGGEPVWRAPDQHSGVLAGLAGVAVRERWPDQFLDVHLALFSARHDRGLDLRDRTVIAQVLNDAGVDSHSVLSEVDSGWPLDRARADHEEGVQRWAVFGVPTFVMGDRAVFVRLMHRPQGDGKLAESAIERVLDLAAEFPQLNEYKFTQIPR